MELAELIKLLVSSGGGAALVVLLYWFREQSEKERRAVTERYISSLESRCDELEAQVANQDERPTRPIRPKVSARV